MSHFETEPFLLKEKKENWKEKDRLGITKLTWYYYVTPLNESPTKVRLLRLERQTLRIKQNPLTNP